MRTLWGLSFVLFAAVPAQAQDTTTQDKLLADGLKEMHNKAADLYNGGDTNGCYRMFQGGLVTARHCLAHRPDLQQVIDQVAVSGPPGSVAGGQSGCRRYHRGRRTNSTAGDGKTRRPLGRRPVLRKLESGPASSHSIRRSADCNP